MLLEILLEDLPARQRVPSRSRPGLVEVALLAVLRLMPVYDPARPVVLEVRRWCMRRRRRRERARVARGGAR